MSFTIDLLYNGRHLETLDGDILSLHVSTDTSKLGPIPAISTAPGRTCSEEACRTCFREGCYAYDSYRQYPSTKQAWDQNTLILGNPTVRALAEQVLNEYFAKLTAPRFFRLYMGGDLQSREVAEMWARIAAKAPGTRFLCFTKQWDFVRGIKFPANFELVLSGWPGTQIPDDLRAQYRVAHCVESRDEIPEGALECPGHCDSCGMCWSLSQLGRDIWFLKH